MYGSSKKLHKYIFLKKKDISALLQTPFRKERPVYKYQAKEKLPNFDLSQHSCWFSSIEKKYDSEYCRGWSGSFSSPNSWLHTMKPTCSKQNPGSTRGLGKAFKISAQNHLHCPRKQLTACALLIVNKWYCHTMVLIFKQEQLQIPRYFNKTVLVC